MAVSSKQRFLREFSKALMDDAGVVFVGAGVSMGAGYPSWTKLLSEIGEEIGVKSSDIHDLAALAQWSIQETGGSTAVKTVIRDQISPDKPIPAALEIVARLPTRHIWTTNYDRLIERAFSDAGRPIDSISGPKDLSMRARPGAVRLYKMHGSVDRLDDIVISTDDYEMFKKKRGEYLPLLQAHLTSMSLLFVGLSFADPNIRHVLSLIRESFSEEPPEHFAIVRPPQREDFSSDVEYEARTAQHKLWSKDLRRYGLIAVEIDDYHEVPSLLLELERRVARHRVWISGSWPVGIADAEATRAYEVARDVGHLIGEIGLTLVCGAGLVVGTSAIGGFLDSLRQSGSWDLDRRLIVRPFPQPLEGNPPNRPQWHALRLELARLAGTVIFVGGAKSVDGVMVDADGVMEEARLAQESGAFLLPIGLTRGVCSNYR